MVLLSTCRQPYALSVSVLTAYVTNSWGYAPLVNILGYHLDQRGVGGHVYQAHAITALNGLARRSYIRDVGMLPYTA